MNNPWKTWIYSSLDPTSFFVWNLWTKLHQKKRADETWWDNSTQARIVYRKGLSTLWRIPYTCDIKGMGKFQSEVIHYFFRWSLSSKANKNDSCALCIITKFSTSTKTCKRVSDYFQYRLWFFVRLTHTFCSCLVIRLMRPYICMLRISYNIDI